MSYEIVQHSVLTETASTLHDRLYRRSICLHPLAICTRAPASNASCHSCLRWTCSLAAQELCGQLWPCIDTNPGKG